MLLLLEFLFDLIYFIQKCGNQRTLPLSVAEYLLLKIKNILNNWVLKSQEKIMYCIFKMDKNPIGTSFITASKICSTKQKWDVIGCRGRGVSECSGRLVFIFLFLKTIGFGTRPDIMLIIYYWQKIFLLSLSLTPDSEVIL